MRIRWIHKYIFDIFDRQFEKRLQKITEKKLRENTALWEGVVTYRQRSQSSGASYSDYWVLYNYIRAAKPKEVLECGTGVTTVVIAHALWENEMEDGVTGHLTSMEDLQEYYQMARGAFPQQLKKYVDIVYSRRVEDFYQIFRGVRYEDVPERPYDFVYIDGPGTTAPSDGAKTFDFDLIRIIQRSNHPVFAIVDTRMSTCLALRHILKEGKVFYDYRYNVGLIGPCTKDDLQLTDQIVSSLGPRPLRSGSVSEILNNK